MTNFHKGNASEPSILSHMDMVTFFHEFGHVMHFILNEANFSRFSGSSVEKDGTAGVVESTKAASDVYTPVSGEVVDTNQAIVDDPAKINEDPEGSAWFFKLKLKDSSEMDSLMNKEEYDKFAKESAS